MGDANYYDPMGMCQVVTPELLFCIIAGQAVLFTILCIARDFRDHW